MAGQHWLRLAAALQIFVGLFLHVDASSDVVHSEEVPFTPYQKHPEAITPSYDSFTEQEQATLSCYDCTSYMPSCKRKVTDLGGEIVSRTGCKTKCFLRVGEEQSGALYRGCMDDFISAQLTQDYVGCKVQEWNLRKSLWCLCDGDLCNGQSLKSLFYYGYGSPEKPTSEIEGKQALVPAAESMDNHFDHMTSKVHNFNSVYVSKTADSEVANNAVTEPLDEVPPLDDMLETADKTGFDSNDYQTDDLTAYKTEDSQDDKQQVEEPTHIKERITDGTAAQEGEVSSYIAEEPPAPYSEQLPASPGYIEEHHLPLPNIYPMPSVEQIPSEEHGQYPPMPAAPFHLIPESDYGTMPPYPYQPEIHSQFKYPDEAPAAEATFSNEATGEANEEAIDEKVEEGEVQYKSPEGKSAVVDASGPATDAEHLDEFFKFPPQDIAPYPYHYGNPPPDFELEPVKYIPFEETKAVEELKGADEHVEVKKAEAPEEEQPELDAELYCPSAGIFTYEEDCSKFVMCLIDHIYGRPRMYVMKCPGGLVFDSAINTCMAPELSNGCQRHTTPKPKLEEPTPAPKVRDEELKQDRGTDSYETSQLFEYGYN